jgi:hypothetical protein
MHTERSLMYLDSRNLSDTPVAPAALTDALLLWARASVSEVANLESRCWRCLAGLVQVLTWAALKNDDFFVGGATNTGLTQSALFDPKTGKVSKMTVSNTKHDMFCPGAHLPL